MILLDFPENSNSQILFSGEAPAIGMHEVRRVMECDPRMHEFRTYFPKEMPLNIALGLRTKRLEELAGAGEGFLFILFVLLWAPALKILDFYFDEIN